MKTQREGNRYSSIHTQPWHLKGVDGCHAPAPVPLEKRPGTRYRGSWVDLGASPGGYRGSYPHWGVNNGPFSS